MNIINSDRSLTPLFKILLVVCMFLTFGTILNSITTSHEKKLSENERQTQIRISLIREEYDRKITEKGEKNKMSCDQKIAELTSYFKRVSKEAEEKLLKQMEEKHALELKNKTDEIERLKKELGKDSQGVNRLEDPTRKSKMGLFVEIEKQLSEIKSELHSRSRESTDIDEKGKLGISKEEADYYIQDKKILDDITKKLQEAKEIVKDS